MAGVLQSQKLLISPGRNKRLNTRQMPRQPPIRFGVGHAQPRPGGACAHEQSDYKSAGRRQQGATGLSSARPRQVNVLSMATGIVNAENGNLSGGEVGTFWNHTFENVDSPLTYCTIGEDAFRGALDYSVKGKRVGDRELRVRHLKEREQVEGCQVLFIRTAQRVRQAEQLTNASGRPVLTVGETEHFARDGGIIGFCLEEQKVRFEINLNAAEQAQLKISAKLLSLAKTVPGNSRGD